MTSFISGADRAQVSSLFFDDKDLNPTSVHTATDADHGRIETRVSAVSKTR
jgi:hypothetical protein